MTTRKQVWTHILLLSVVSITLGIMGAVTWDARRAEREAGDRRQAQREQDEWLTAQMVRDGTSGTDLLTTTTLVWEPAEWTLRIDLSACVGPDGAAIAWGEQTVAFVSSQGAVTLPDDGEDESEAWLLGDECPRCEGNVTGARARPSGRGE